MSGDDVTPGTGWSRPPQPTPDPWARPGPALASSAKAERWVRDGHQDDAAGPRLGLLMIAAAGIRLLDAGRLAPADLNAAASLAL